MRLSDVNNVSFLFATLLITLSALGQPLAPLIEHRYCGPPKRNAVGQIIRRADVIAAFKKVHPCPVTGSSTGPCTGWAIDHVLPLKCGGCDAVSNLQWLPNRLKNAAVVGKDRFEWKIYCVPMQTVK